MSRRVERETQTDPLYVLESWGRLADTLQSAEGDIGVGEESGDLQRVFAKLRKDRNEGLLSGPGEYSALATSQLVAKAGRFKEMPLPPSMLGEESLSQAVKDQRQRKKGASRVSAADDDLDDIGGGSSDGAAWKMMLCDDDDDARGLPPTFLADRVKHKKREESAKDLVDIVDGLRASLELARRENARLLAEVAESSGKFGPLVSANQNLKEMLAQRSEVAEARAVEVAALKSELEPLKKSLAGIMEVSRRVLAENDSNHQRIAAAEAAVVSKEQACALKISQYEALVASSVKREEMWASLESKCELLKMDVAAEAAECCRLRLENQSLRTELSDVRGVIQHQVGNVTAMDISTPLGDDADLDAWRLRACRLAVLLECERQEKEAAVKELGLLRGTAARVTE